MRERIERAEKLATDARNRGLQLSDKAARESWLEIARLWEKIAREYEEMERLQRRVIDAT